MHFVNGAVAEIKIKYIQSGRPMRNAYIELLNRTFRENVLDAYLLETLEEAGIMSDEWQENYNNKYPHTALQGRTPKAVNQCLPAGSFFSPTIEKIQSIGEKKEIKSNLPQS